MKNKYFSVKDWERWKFHVKNFYKTYLYPKSQEVARVFIQQPMDNRPGANVSVVGKKGIKLLERLNTSILPFQLKSVFTVDGTHHSIQVLLTYPL